MVYKIDTKISPSLGVLFNEGNDEKNVRVRDMTRDNHTQDKNCHISQ